MIHPHRLRLGRSLPDNEVVVVMINEGWDTAVGVILGELGGLVFALLELEVHRLVGESELLKNDGGLPVNSVPC